MRTVLVAFLFCLTSSIANAEAYVTRKPVFCTSVKTLIETLRKDHEEMPLMLGTDSNNENKYSLFVNRQTGTWTFIQFDAEDACMLGNGINVKLILGKNS